MIRMNTIFLSRLTVRGYITWARERISDCENGLRQSQTGSSSKCPAKSNQNLLRKRFYHPRTQISPMKTEDNAAAKVYAFQHYSKNN